MKKLFSLLCVVLIAANTIYAEPQNAAPKLYSVIMHNQDMNFMYRDYDNKFSVSVPGVSGNAVSVTAQGAAVRRLNGTWIFNPEADAKTVTVAIYATIDGKKQTVANYVYRVKALPKPEAFLSLKDKDYYSGSKIPMSYLKDPGIRLKADYGNESVLHLPYKVVSFCMMINGQTYTVEGDAFSEEQILAIGKLKAYSYILIYDIKVKSPKDKIYMLSPVMLTVF